MEKILSNMMLEVFSALSSVWRTASGNTVSIHVLHLSMRIWRLSISHLPQRHYRQLCWADNLSNFEVIIFKYCQNALGSSTSSRQGGKPKARGRNVALSVGLHLLYFIKIYSCSCDLRDSAAVRRQCSPSPTETSASLILTFLFDVNLILQVRDIIIQIKSITWNSITALWCTSVSLTTGSVISRRLIFIQTNRLKLFLYI